MPASTRPQAGRARCRATWAGLTALSCVMFGGSHAIGSQLGAVICGDYQTSATVGQLQLASPWTFTPDLQPVYHDAIGVWHGGLVYIVNRAGADNIQVLDPAQGFATVRQFSLGLGRGLKHIAFAADGTAWVSCYDTTELLHVNPVTGAVLHVVSTAAFADADGLPETSWLVVDGQRLFVVCERLDRNNWYAPVGDSYLLALDMPTRAWIDCDPTLPGVQGIRLAATNPYCEPVREGKRLLIGCSGYFAVQDGGVAVVDLPSLSSLGLEITEAQLGGDIVELAAGLDGRRHAVVSSATFATSLKAYVPGGAVTSLHASTGFHHADIAYDGGSQIVVADRRPGQSGIRIFHAGTGAQLTTAPIATGLPPAFVVLPAASTAPVLDLPPAHLVMSPPYPNPANPRARLRFAGAPATVVELRVLDMRGRLVRRATVGVAADGAGEWEFDGLTDIGRPAPSGVYRIVAHGAGGMAARSLTLVR